MTFSDEHELAMLRSQQTLMDDYLLYLPVQFKGAVRKTLDMAFSQGALFILKRDLAQQEEKLNGSGK